MLITKMQSVFGGRIPGQIVWPLSVVTTHQPAGDSMLGMYRIVILPDNRISC